MVIKIKEKTCRQVHFSVPSDHGVKIKESEKIYKYFDLAREQKSVEPAGDSDCIWCALGP